MKTLISVTALLLSSQSFAAELADTKQQALEIATMELAKSIKHNSISLNKVNKVKLSNEQLTIAKRKQLKQDITPKRSELSE